MNRFTAYINDSLEELRHVRWPTRQQAIRFSGVVIAFVIVSAIVLGGIDFGLSKVIQALLSLV